MSQLVATGSLREFFKELFGDASQRHAVTLDEFTEFYVVNLLSEFATSERLFTQDLDGRKDHEPLALLYTRAMNEDREGRVRTLRRLGDVSLYKAGFFRGSLERGVVGPDYYIQMGGAAYGQVAQLTVSSSFGKVYQELAEKFRALVAVLEEIAMRGLAANGPAGMLKVYESYVRSGNQKLEQVLVDAGLVVKKDGMPN